MTASADTPPTRPKPTGGARTRPLTAAALARRNAKPDQVDLPHPVREPDDRPAHDRTQPDPNRHDPVKPTRRRGTPSTTTADTPSPPAGNRTPQSPQSPRPPRPETTAAAAPDEKAGPVDEPVTAPARTPPTRPKPTGGGKGASPHRRRPGPQERKAGPGRAHAARARARRPARPRRPTRGGRRSRTCRSPPPTRRPSPDRANPDRRPGQAGPAPRLHPGDHNQHTQPVCR